jgi:hypothetical protein
MKRESSKPQPKLTREQMMDQNAARDFAQMAAANAKPVDLSLLGIEDWMHKGGSCGFKVNGFKGRQLFANAAIAASRVGS